MQKIDLGTWKNLHEYFPWNLNFREKKKKIKLIKKSCLPLHDNASGLLVYIQAKNTTSNWTKFDWYFYLPIIIAIHSPLPNLIFKRDIYKINSKKKNYVDHFEYPFSLSEPPTPSITKMRSRINQWIKLLFYFLLRQDLNLSPFSYQACMHPLYY